jgi:hypothetical protein
MLLPHCAISHICIFCKSGRKRAFTHPTQIHEAAHFSYNGTTRGLDGTIPHTSKLSSRRACFFFLVYGTTTFETCINMRKISYTCRN